MGSSAKSDSIRVFWAYYTVIFPYRNQKSTEVPYQKNENYSRTFVRNLCSKQYNKYLVLSYYQIYRDIIPAQKPCNLRENAVHVQKYKKWLSAPKRARTILNVFFEYAALNETSRYQAIFAG